MGEGRGGRFYLGNGNGIGIFLHLLGKLLVLRLEGLAVAAPGSISAFSQIIKRRRGREGEQRMIRLQQNVLGAVEYDVLEVLADDDDWAIFGLGLGHRLRLDVGFKLACQKGLQVLLERLAGEQGGCWEFVALLGVVNNEGILALR